MLSRSLLFVPANKEKMLININKLSADIVIIDLEDAVPIQEKKISRDLVKKYIYKVNKPIFIRVNSIETEEFLYDMNLIKEVCNASNLKGVMLPKSNSKQAIKNLDTALCEYEKLHDRKTKILIIPLIEEALGIQNINEIIEASNRIFRIAFGGEDFTEDIGATSTVSEYELLYARSKIVIASRAHGIEKPIDTVYTNYKDIEGFKNNAKFVKSLGFSGKLLIHPSQNEIANISFSPTPKEVESAKEIVLLSETNKGAFSLHGKMIDKPIVKKAQNIINEYNLIEAK